MRKYCVLAVVALVAAVMADLAPAQNPPPNPIIVKKDPALEALISPDAKLEKLAGGFGFTEGALWVPKGEGSSLYSWRSADISSLISGASASYKPTARSATTRRSRNSR